MRQWFAPSRDQLATNFPEQPDRSARVNFRQWALPWTLLLLVISVWTSSASAQSVRWQAGDSGDPSEIQLIFEDCAPEGDPQLPQIDGTTLTLVGTSSQATMSTAGFSRSTILTYRARAQRSGAIQIPAFSVQTNKGPLRVSAFTGGVARSAADANIPSRLDPGANTVWAGEVFNLTYTLDVPRRSFNQLGTAIEWNPAPLVIEEWSKFEPSESVVGGESRLYITSNTRAYAKESGSMVLNAANQLVNIQSGSVGFGLFQTPRIEQLSVTSNRPAIAVRPLPTPAPAGFSGAVGQFKLTSKIVPNNAAVGEPVTWTLDLTGTGNWPDIAGLPSRQVSNDFSVVQPQAKRTPTGGKLFDATLSEDVVLVPTRAGSYTLGPVEFVYFDPASGEYKTASTPRTTITISPAPTAAGSGTTAPVVSSPTIDKSAPDDPTRSGRKSPAAPRGIPREPLEGSMAAMVPLSLDRLVTFALLPFALLPVLWGWFALKRAQKTDPLRPRREAHARLRSILSRLRSETTPQLSARGSQLLINWQHDSAILWGIPHAAPAPVALPEPAWAALWAEADQALYSSNRVLPADWIARAESALAAKRVKSFSPLRLFLPQNLLPFVATVAVMFNVASVVLAQDIPTSNPSPAITAYRGGDFGSAEKMWRDTLGKNPTDGIARYNLSLAVAQQDRWPESVAHAMAAFIQNPSNTPARWQLALAGD
ncbi:MAG TPA: BatD family protein, partial [Opitutus sp.]|nr:BatD family protein [Opitutus sp.]